MDFNNSVKSAIIPIKHILGYLTGFIFLIALIAYIYCLIIDNIEKDDHTKEEVVWIYGFLILLIIGFLLSIYIISKSSRFKEELKYKIKTNEMLKTSKTPKSSKSSKSSKQ